MHSVGIDYGSMCFDDGVFFSLALLCYSKHCWNFPLQRKMEKRSLCFCCVVWGKYGGEQNPSFFIQEGSWQCWSRFPHSIIDAIDAGFLMMWFFNVINRWFMLSYAGCVLWAVRRTVSPAKGGFFDLNSLIPKMGRKANWGTKFY